MENQTTNQEQTNPSTAAYCKNCGAMLSPDLQECPMCGADLENTLPTKTHNGLRKSRIIIFILVTILVITGIVLFTHRNVIMGNIKCKSGDYSSAVQYYEKEVADGGGSQNVKNTYSALTNYLEALDAYARDDMETLSNYLENLTTITSKYPTPEEIKTLSNQYTTRNNEIISYDKSIEEIVKLFADVSKIDEIQNKCNELLQKNVTDVQTNKINDIKTNATNYTNIKNSYDKKDYEDVVKRVSELPETYTQYETKDEIENMREKSQDILDERALIQTKLQAMRNNLSAEAYDMVIITADELLELNITNEEKEEVEKAKTTAEAKIEEQKAAAAKAEQEARQNRINNAIKISAAELYEAFTTNEVGADNKYKNKTLIVTGDIYQIDKVFLFGNPVIYLQAGYTADAIYASFSKSDADGLTDLKQGQTVRILGQCTGYSLGSVMLSDCSVIE